MKNRVAVIVVCTIVAWVAVVGGARNQPPQTSPQARWEYRIVSQAQLSGLVSLEDPLEKVRTVEELEALNNDVAHRMTDLGQQGWELVCLQSDRSFVFKRKIS